MTEPISIPSRTSRAREPDGVPPLYLIELTPVDCHSCPESADRFSESANLIVNTGLMLGRRRVQMFGAGTDGVNVQ